MEFHKTDFKGLTTTHWINFAKSKGWKIVDQDRKFMTFTKKGLHDTIALPALETEKFDDYFLRIVEFLGDLALEEDKSSYALLNEIHAWRVSNETH
jgi:hypothetical protein